MQKYKAIKCLFRQISSFSIFFFSLFYFVFSRVYVILA